MTNMETFTAKNDCLKSSLGYGNFSIHDRAKDD